jgi:hypothetical protein
MSNPNAKDQFWRFLVERNPELEQEPQFQKTGIRKFFDLVWNTAYEQGAFDMYEREEDIVGGNLPVENLTSILLKGTK